ncbi:hypothetical protein [Sphingomonas sp. ID0503]|uniref:hypothetical protein n=1 Tax=Sphingomonas sp. ID0503 TaxID=3399691 RepID=UPI003AFA5D34
MIPSIDDRLASVARALSDVVLPALPPEAGLAAEQVQLAIGHLQIIRSQIDAAPAFEAEELADTIELTRTLLSLVDDQPLSAALLKADAATTPGDIRQARAALNREIARVLLAEGGRDEVRSAVIDAERARSRKDREWFKPFGFDPDRSG